MCGQRFAGSSMSQIKVFWVAPLEDRVRVALRRFSFSNDHKCTERAWGCDAEFVIIDNTSKSSWPDSSGDSPEVVPHNDPRWPKLCESCSRAFTDQDEYQLNIRQLFGTADGRVFTLQDAPVGAMWNASWMSEWHHGPDGICLVVRTPGGDWMVDSEASNCTRKGEAHQCWVRHGDPRTG